ncbi:MAG: hypothetical protein SWY16_07545 [Cyanobacteriota bacterium]|nr:hypothetical protein [Cyanobacteriota bacterium]
MPSKASIAPEAIVFFVPAILLRVGKHSNPGRKPSSSRGDRQGDLQKNHLGSQKEVKIL